MCVHRCVTMYMWTTGLSQFSFPVWDPGTGLGPAGPFTGPCANF